MRKTALGGTIGLLLLVSACSRVVVPKGEPAERAKVAAQEGVFAVPVSKRPLPDLSASAPLPLVLEYAFNANGDFEMAYREWRAAIERIPQAGALPDPRLDFGATFNANDVKGFSTLLDKVMLGASQELPGPGKRRARAEQALAEAQASGERFRKAKYELQRKVTRAYAELVLNADLIDLTSQTLRLFRETHEVAAHRYHLGGEAVLADLRKIEVEIQTVESEQRGLLFQRRGLIAELNGILNRKPDASLGKATVPPIQMPVESETDLFTRAVSRNPELAALRKEIEARGAAQTLAALERRPDFMVSGQVEYPLLTPMKVLMPQLGVGMTLPINRARIRAGIAEAVAMRQAAEARYRATESDTLARLVMALVAIRDTRRIKDDYQARIMPKTQELLDTQLSTYGSGGGEFLDILDTERTLIDFRKLLLQAESDRLRFLAELEEVIGEDLFKFMPADPSPKETVHD